MTLGTLVVGIIVAAIIFLAARSLHRDKKSGSMCSGCSGCSGGSCHEAACHCQEQKENQ
ncbi:MAG: FeoB-associated Cys-rich membrane protein [Lachnospiraceae bacterium]